MKQTKDICQNCHKRKATTNWVGEGSMMDFIHGGYERWCEKCVLEAQIAFAEKTKDNLKELKEKLENLKK